MTGHSAAVPPDTSTVTFEEGDAAGLCLWRNANQPRGTRLSSGRTGSASCKLCGMTRAENVFPWAPGGRYTLEAWARQPSDGAQGSSQWFVEIRGVEDGKRIYAPLEGAWAPARVTVAVPAEGADFLEARIGQDDGDVCFEVDDVTLTRE